MTARGFGALAWGGILCAVFGCGMPPPPAPSDTAPSAAPPAVSGAPPVAQTAAARADASLEDASVRADAGPEPVDGGTPAGGAEGDASSAEPPLVADNHIEPPLASDELTRRAKGLFDAIARDDPAMGEAFWFPKEPFIPLKDVKGPERYWETLHSTYNMDIHALHRKRKSWDGAEFVDFTVGSTPKWVKPGDEANKIGYYRSFRGKLRIRIDQALTTIEVHTIISWQGKWYITHLRKFKK